MSVAQLTEQTLEEEIKKSTDKVIIVDFFADWCGPCKMIAPVMEELANEGHAVFKVDIDKEQSVAQKFGISSIPTLIFFKGGEKQGQMVGLSTKEDILEKLSKIS